MDEFISHYQIRRVLKWYYQKKISGLGFISYKLFVHRKIIRYVFFRDTLSQTTSNTCVIKGCFIRNRSRTTFSIALSHYFFPLSLNQSMNWNTFFPKKFGLQISFTLFNTIYISFVVPWRCYFSSPFYFENQTNDDCVKGLKFVQLYHPYYACKLKFCDKEDAEFVKTSGNWPFVRIFESSHIQRLPFDTPYILKLGVRSLSQRKHDPVEYVINWQSCDFILAPDGWFSCLGYLVYCKFLFFTVIYWTEVVGPRMSCCRLPSAVKRHNAHLIFTH